MKTLFYRSFKESFFDFIEKHPKISHLKFTNPKTTFTMDWSRLACSLPLLVKIEILKHLPVSGDEIIKANERFSVLKMFQFKLSDDYDTFLK